MARWKVAEVVAAPTGRERARDRLARLADEAVILSQMTPAEVEADSEARYLRSRALVTELEAWRRKHPGWPIEYRIGDW